MRADGARAEAADPLQPSRPGGIAFVELVRLAVVVLATAGAFSISPELPGVAEPTDGLRLGVTVLGVALGYVGGGLLGRFLLRRVDAAEQRLRSIAAGELLAGVLGAFGGLVMALGLTWPVLLFEGKTITLPLAALATLVLVVAGLRIGAARGGELLRYVGASGRLTVSSPASGPRAKLVDTSALVDGRLLEVCRAGFLEGMLVVPGFVLAELQGLADAGDPERRARGRRGLDVLAALQRSAGIALEVEHRDLPHIEAVDAKLLAMARERRMALITVDGNLGRVAEIQGVAVLNLHALAETLRPPVVPGDVLEVAVRKPGREPAQGVGYLEDGTMVVVEGARELVGQSVSAEVTSITSTSRGRMVFATALTGARTPRLVPRSSR